ncbi:MAG TPA: prenyltransferase/squalene oxidase repeat-containing protein, partial [Rhodospirillales bacterium]|nr:prenyltransferase/squalene oxidase repeat-containing protein [Rhodospirillales bacterium]
MDERIDIARQTAEPWEAERPASDDALGVAIAEAVDGLAERQHDDGHWSFELEADATIPAEYILLNHYLDQIDDAVEAKLAAYLRATQGKHGGWPLYYDGDFNMSASVKAYYALKLAGEDIDAPHMAWARSAIRNHGGAVRCNVFTRIALALFGQLPWRAVPVTRAEVMLAPKWFPFHINKVSYWSRTVMIPLTVLTVLKPVARNPRGIGVEELFVRPPGEEKHYMTNPTGTWVGEAMLVLDRIGRACEHLCPKPLERRAITKAMAWVKERLNGEDGLGGIFP